jgi:hypothetical protein
VGTLWVMSLLYLFNGVLSQPIWSDLRRLQSRPPPGGGPYFIRVTQIGQLGRRGFCHTETMATKTIPTYLEDECRKPRDIQLRICRRSCSHPAAHHGRHRSSKQPELALAPLLGVAAKGRKAVATAQKKLCAA